MKHFTRKAPAVVGASDLLDEAFAARSEQRSTAPKETAEQTDEEPVQRTRREHRLVPKVKPITPADYY